MTNALTTRHIIRALGVLLLGILSTISMPRRADANLITIDFNNLAHGDVITDQFSGVQFSLLGSAPTAGPVAYALKDGTIANTGSPLNIFGASGLAMTSGSVTTTIFPPFFDIQVAFAEPIDFFSIMVLDAEEAFSVKGFLGSSLVQEVVRSSATFIANRSDSPFRGPVFQVTLGAIGSSAHFDRIVIDLDESDGPELYDNLMFNTVRVTEPSSLALFAIGLAGISFVMRLRLRGA